MIPKVIHYCWFGKNPIPESDRKCIESWKRFCPDYEIIEWNEDNFDINSCEYVKQAYDAKKWAFVSDYARLYALYNYGGVYMDTDVEILKPIDSLLNYAVVSSFESKAKISTGLIAAEAKAGIIKELLDEYNNMFFIKKDGSFDLTTNVERITNTLLKYGLKLNNKEQTVCGFTLLPSDYLCPKDFFTGKMNITENTYVIHHFSGSWQTETGKKLKTLRYKCTKKFGDKKGRTVYKFLSIPLHLKDCFLRGGVKEIFAYIKRKLK